MVTPLVQGPLSETEVSVGITMGLPKRNKEVHTGINDLSQTANSSPNASRQTQFPHEVSKSKGT